MKQETDGGSFIFGRYSAISGSERAAIHYPAATHHPPDGTTLYSSTAMQQLFGGGVITKILSTIPKKRHDHDVGVLL